MNSKGQNLLIKQLPMKCPGKWLKKKLFMEYFFWPLSCYDDDGAGVNGLVRDRLGGNDDDVGNNHDDGDDYDHDDGDDGGGGVKLQSKWACQRLPN